MPVRAIVGGWNLCLRAWMQKMAKKPPADAVCFLCGGALHGSPSSRGHIVPSQFFPEEMRRREQLAHPRAWAHTKCDGDYKDDEEYFYAGLYPKVATNNPAFAASFLTDIRRRAKKPQMRNLIRTVLRDSGSVTKGGIHLPRNMVVWSLDEHRLQRVVVKIARGLLFKVHQRYFADNQCFDVRLCENVEDVPELYDLIVQGTPPSVIHEHVFTSWQLYMPDEKTHLIAMLFWEAFLWCAGFTAGADVTPPDGRKITRQIERQ